MNKAEGAEEPVAFGCNCRGGVQVCPFNGECKTTGLVYRADVEADGKWNFYIGQTADTFKTRYNGHKSDKKLGKRRTELTKHLLNLERKDIVPKQIIWSKVKRARPRQKGDKTCQLCLSEKTYIAIGGEGILNRRSELIDYLV